MLLVQGLSAQDKDADSTRKKQKEIIKEGLGFGFLPVIGYNTDVGLQYGVIVNLFNYGDGSFYPEYKYSIYTEVSRTTKGSGINQVFFDSKHLLPGRLRITADLSYLTELALNFYGFNGYDAVYRNELENDESDQYISRMYYRHQRKFTRFTMDLQGPLAGDRFRWFAGIGYFDFRVEGVDIDRLNKGKKEEDLLPDTTHLYDQYVDWGLIGANEKDGGNVPSLKLGLIYDTRDHEVSPMKGIWTEALLFYSPPILGNEDFAYLKLAITHRQYFTIIKDILSFAYRLGYQGTLGGKVPFYMEPYMISSFAMVTTTDGLGGAKTLRGILRNRVVGDGVGYGNFEFRWKFFRTVLWKQNLYLDLNAFYDAGRVLKEKEIVLDPSLGPADPENYFSPGAESWHSAAGIGIRIVLNRNFVVAFDYGKAFDKRDGKDGIYAGIGYLF
jgi:outer membrane protein assembly factor BamA